MFEIKYFNANGKLAEVNYRDEVDSLISKFGEHEVEIPDPRDARTVYRFTSGRIIEISEGGFVYTAYENFKDQIGEYDFIPHDPIKGLFFIKNRD